MNFKELKIKDLLVPFTAIIIVLILVLSYMSIELSKINLAFKKYKLNRINDCIENYSTIKSLANNTSNFTYNKDLDICEIFFKNPEWKEGQDESTMLFSKEF
jgi:hypothetical protein